MAKIAVEIDCDGEFCGKCEGVYIDDDGCEVCGILNGYLHLENKRLKRRTECIAAELKAGDE